MENKISFALNNEEQSQVDQAMEVLNKVLESKLISLSASDRRELPKMGDKTVAFVEKSIHYGKLYPDFIPSFIDVHEAEIDLESVRSLRKILTPLQRIVNEIDDTMTLAGIEAYTSARSIYKVIKNAAVIGQPGATEATKELKKRFPNARKKSEASAEE